MKIMTFDFEQNATLLMQGIHPDPHSYLGVNQGAIYLHRPGHNHTSILLGLKEVSACKTSHDGIFKVELNDKNLLPTYKVKFDSWEIDPYCFGPSFEKEEAELFQSGKHFQLYDFLGSHQLELNGQIGYRFLVWAPNAKGVSLALERHDFDPYLFPMRNNPEFGIWEIFIPGLKESSCYKYAIFSKENTFQLKADPFANYAQMRPEFGSVTYNINHVWKDANWIKKREEYKVKTSPLNVYEVHLGSWQRDNGSFLNYQKIGAKLASYCKKMRYTHVELLPITEHPLDESWGYQVTGYFAPTSRFGTPQDFQEMIEILHENQIGVILDFVPGHFPMDLFSLAQFDGSYLYEHEDKRLRFHPEWNTLIFDYGKSQVRNFLIASALFWIEKMHVDGLRIDAVYSMLYLDYARKKEEWIPNRFGGRENLDAIAFLQELNQVIHHKHSGVITIAEDCSTHPGITTLVEEKGLGFDLKWNMGWSHDTLRFFVKKETHRFEGFKDITHAICYYYSENHLSILSHDEVGNHLHHLITRMPGSDFEKFANMRLLLSFQMCHPGKKGTFMGIEFAHVDSWNCVGELSWELLENKTHYQFQTFVSDLNEFYLNSPSLFQKDFEKDGFVVLESIGNSKITYSYLRIATDHQLICIHNFSSKPIFEHQIQHNFDGKPSICLNSDSKKYGGKDYPCNFTVKSGLFLLDLPPLSTIMVDFSKGT